MSEAMDEIGQLEERIVMALKTVYDPEIPVDIYELGLIYGIDISPDATHASSAPGLSPRQRPSVHSCTLPIRS